MEKGWVFFLNKHNEGTYTPVLKING